MAATGSQRISFEEFMDWALYDRQTGYYSQAPEKIIGKQGDFFTASQLQPAFGKLMATLLPSGPVLELGPGRGEMQPFFGDRGYLAVLLGQPLPALWQGHVFANEYLDALPVIAGIRQGGELRELLVRRRGSTCTWEVGDVLSPERQRYVEQYYPGLPEGSCFEIAERALRCIRQLGECVTAGTVWLIDYGWAGDEWLRFPQGTLMSYRGHHASAAVLDNPGRQDITAHVPFRAVMDVARQAGFAILRFETLAQTVVSALKARPELLNCERDRAAVKTLLFGMGQTFRTLVLEKLPQNEKGSGCPEPHVMELIPNGT